MAVPEMTQFARDLPKSQIFTIWFWILAHLGKFKVEQEGAPHFADLNLPKLRSGRRIDAGLAAHHPETLSPEVYAKDGLPKHVTRSSWF